MNLIVAIHRSGRIGALLLSAALAACGGGGGGGGGGDTSLTPGGVSGTLSGTAAVGAAIAGGTVEVKCAAGPDPAPVTTSSTGAWTASVSGITLPCKVKVSGGDLAAGSVLHSIAVNLGTVNITPLTDLVVANLSGQNPATWYASVLPADLGRISAAAVTTAVGNVRAAINASAFGSSVDPITTALSIGDAVDKILDALKVAVPDYAALLTAARGQNFATVFAGTYGTALNTALAGGGTAGGGSGGGATAGGSGSITAALAPASSYVVAYTGSLCKERSNTRNCDIGLDIRAATVTLGSRGELTGYSDASRPEEAPTLGSAVVSELGGNADLSWGRWNGGALSGRFYSLDYASSSLQASNGFHYVVGKNSPSLPTSGTATYTAVSATAPTYTSASSAARVGSVDLVASKARIDFASGKVGFDVSYNFGGDDNRYTLRTTNGISQVAGSQFAFGTDFAPTKAAYLVNPSSPVEFLANGVLAAVWQSSNHVYLIPYGAEATYLALVFHDRNTSAGVIIFRKDGAAGATGGGTTNPLLAAASCSPGITTGFSLVAEVTVAGTVSIPVCVDGLSAKPATEAEFCGNSEFRQGLPPGITLNSCGYNPSSGVANITATLTAVPGIPGISYTVKYTFISRS